MIMNPDEKKIIIGSNSSDIIEMKFSDTNINKSTVLHFEKTIMSAHYSAI